MNSLSTSIIIIIRVLKDLVYISLIILLFLPSIYMYVYV